MRKRIISVFASLAIALAASLTLTACEEEKGPAEKIGENIDESIENLGESVEEAGEEIQDSSQ